MTSRLVLKIISQKLLHNFISNQNQITNKIKQNLYQK